MSNSQFKSEIKKTNPFKGNWSLVIGQWSLSRGFTIAEMLTVTIVIAILASIGSRTYFIERDRFEYNESFNQLLGMIETARNAAIAHQSVFDVSQGKQVVPPNGYGVYIQLSPSSAEPHFTLFASLGDDDQNPQTYNTRFDRGVAAKDPDVVVETYRLPPAVSFQFMLFDADGKGLKEMLQPDAQAAAQFSPSKKETVIFFRPPLAETYLGDQSGQALQALRLRFFNPKAPAASPKRCSFVSIQRLQGFAQLSHSDCSESQYVLPH